MFYFVLGILALIVLAAVLFNLVPALAERLGAQISKWLFGGWVSNEPNELTEAIACSYYRCAEGCAAAIAKVDSTLFDCSKYCKDEGTDSEGKICGERAKFYHIKTSKLSEATTISSEVLDFEDCLMSEKDYTNADGGDRTLVLVDENDVSETIGEGQCMGIHLYGNKYDALEVKSGNYYIWTWGAPGLLGKKDTSVTSSPPFEEINIQSDVETRIDLSVGGGTESEIYRIAVGSGTNIIDEAFLKVEGIESTQGCGTDFRDHPRISFRCEETIYFDTSACVDKSMVCGQFSLTFRKYVGLFSKNATFDIIYTGPGPILPAP